MPIHSASGGRDGAETAIDSVAGVIIGGRPDRERQEIPAHPSTTGIIQGKSKANRERHCHRKALFGRQTADQMPRPARKRFATTCVSGKCLMKSLALLVLLSAGGLCSPAFAQKAAYDSMVATHAQANGVPEALVHRVIVRESRYQPSLIGRGGAIGLMQIKLATARGLGYTGTAEGLRDPETNLTYAVKYLAGAFRTAGGDFNRAVSYYAGGYYYAAKRQRHEKSAPPHQPIFAKDAERLKLQATVDANALAPKP
jgi:hypothetical protein